MSLLKTEIAYYDQHYEELLLGHPNRFVLIHGGNLVGVFDKHSNAVADGVRRYGRSPFLVRRTGDKQIVLTAPALSLGLLSSIRQRAA